MSKRNAVKIIWNFLWNSNSIWSWILDLLILFVIIKFIFFPLLGLALATKLPMVIVETPSMVHQGSFDSWWQNFGAWYENKNITKQDAEEWPFRNGINPGDIVIVKGFRNGLDLKQGEVIVFDAHQQVPIIHRVMYFNSVIGTKGDNNREQRTDETTIPKSDVIGKAVFRIPKLGWVKLIFVKLINGF